MPAAQTDQTRGSHRPPAEGAGAPASRLPTLALALALSLALGIPLLASCGKNGNGTPAIIPGPGRDAEADALLSSDPGGPIPRPAMPTSISSMSPRDRGFHRDRADRGRSISYTVETLCPDMPEVVEAFEKSSDLYVLNDRPVYSHLTLARRLRSGLALGKDLLASMGFYEGTAEGTNVASDDNGRTVKITVTLTPGPLYHVGGISFLPSARPMDGTESADAGQPGSQGSARPGAGTGAGATAGSGSGTGAVAGSGTEAGTGAGHEASPPGAADAGSAAAPLPELPELTLRGVKVGDPAVAAAILDGVDSVDNEMGRIGRPFAEVTASRYWLDPEKKLLYIEISVWPGEFVRMGPLNIQGDNPTKPGFVEDQVTWKRGEPW
ncbi:MAG: hypothetical protein LBQ79_14615, partial [Deltaproteobacteria bacterium]|nr:hypothetical protein [Deltaproteobacteria bacterium]